MNVQCCFIGIGLMYKGIMKLIQMMVQWFYAWMIEGDLKKKIGNHWIYRKIFLMIIGGITK